MLLHAENCSATPFFQFLFITIDFDDSVGFPDTTMGRCLVCLRSFGVILAKAFPLNRGILKLRGGVGI